MHKKLKLLAALAILALAASGCSFIKYEREQTTGSAVYYEGRLTSRIERPLDDVQNAALAAYRQFGIVIIKNASDRLSGVVLGGLASGDQADTKLSSISSGETEVSIKVGGDGNIYISHRILKEIKRNLKRPSPGPPL